MIPFSPPRIDDKTIEEVVSALKSGWITTGPKTKLFEKKITEYCNSKVSVALNSATAGLELVLRWFGVKEGDEVILPAYTYCATANVIMHCGATPVFVDVNETDFNISVDAIKSAITERTKVIMPVDFAGFPCDYQEINELVKSSDVVSKFTAETIEQEQLGRILVLSDSAHSFGAFYQGKRAGALTDISVFSFHAVKNLTTAEGGAISFNLPDNFNHEELYKQFCVTSLHGQNKDALAKTQKGNWRYDIVEAGYKCNMTDISAAIGLVEIERYDSETLVKRKSVFDAYNNALSQYDWAEIPPYESDEKVSSYHLFPLRIKGVSENQRDQIIQQIFDQDVSVNVHFIPVPMMTYYKEKGFSITYFPITYSNFSREISLPVYYDLSEEQVEIVIQAVIKAVETVIR